MINKLLNSDQVLWETCSLNSYFIVHRKYRLICRQFFSHLSICYDILINDVHFSGTSICHYSDIIWASQHLRLFTIELFIQKLVDSNNNKHQSCSLLWIVLTTACDVVIVSMSLHQHIQQCLQGMEQPVCAASPVWMPHCSPLRYQFSFNQFG